MNNLPKFFLKISQIVEEIWSRQKSVMGEQMVRRTDKLLDRWTDNDHFYNSPSIS